MIEDEIIQEVFDTCIKENNVDYTTFLFTFNRKELEDLIRFVISQT